MKLTGCCGHDCSRCITYQATANNDDSLREQAKVFYKENFNYDIPLQNIRCMGCQSDCVFNLAEDCPFTKCAQEKKIKHCSDCGNYPCLTLTEYQKKYVNKCNQI